MPLTQQQRAVLQYLVSSNTKVMCQSPGCADPSLQHLHRPAAWASPGSWARRPIPGPTSSQLNQRLRVHSIPGDLEAIQLFIHRCSESHVPHTCPFLQVPLLHMGVCAHTNTHTHAPTHTNNHCYWFGFAFQCFILHIKTNAKICTFPTIPHS